VRQRPAKARPLPLKEHAPARSLVLASTDTLYAAQACRLWRAPCQAAPAPSDARTAGARQAPRTRRPRAPSPSPARAPETLCRPGARLAGPPVDHKHVQREAVQRVERVRLADVQVQVALRRGRALSAGRASSHAARARQLARAPRAHAGRRRLLTTLAPGGSASCRAPAAGDDAARR